MANPLIVRARSLGTTVGAFTPGQKVLAVLGVGVIALGGSALYRAAAAPTYTPLFSNLAPADASAIVDQLGSGGVQYELEDGGTTIMVPQEVVSAERLKAAAAGLPGSSDTGYALLDKAGMTSSQFQQQVTYQRALEGELAATVKGIRGVRSAVVHLAIPEKTVFEDQTSPPTASVLVDTGPGASLNDSQVQSIVNLVSSSVPEMSADGVTVSDASGAVLTAAGTDGVGGVGGRDDQTKAYEDKTAAGIQRMLDTVLGPGRAVATVTAELNFDKTSTTNEQFTSTDGVPPLNEKTSTETYTGGPRGVGGALGDNGVLGQDGNEAGANADGTDGGYEKVDATRNNAVDKLTTATTLAPGSVRKQSVAVVVDTGAAAGPGVAQLQQMVTTAAGIDAARGDSVSVNQVAFDTTAADQAAEELAAARAADAAAARTDLYRQGAIAAVILLAFVVALVLWRRAAKRRARQVVDLGELDAIYGAGRADDRIVDQDGAAIGPPAEQIALMPAGPSPAALRRAQVGEMVDESPAEVADVLRGWMGQR